MALAKLRVVLVELEYPENLGLIARAVKNFGCIDLYLVNPKPDRNSVPAKSRALHAQDVLKKAKIVKTLASALKGVDFSIGTTARLSKDNKFFRKAQTLKQASEQFANSGKKIALVFGKESAGLTNEEIEQCDSVITIPTSRLYRSLNISHAVCICMYQFYNERAKTIFRVGEKKTRKALLEKAWNKIQKNEDIDNKQGVMEAVKALVLRVPVTEKELRALFMLFQ